MNKNADPDLSGMVIFFLMGLFLGAIVLGPFLWREFGQFNRNELLEKNIIEYNVKTGELEYVEKYKTIGEK